MNAGEFGSGETADGRATERNGEEVQSRALDGFRGFSTRRPASNHPISAELLLQKLGIKLDEEGKCPSTVDLSHKCITAHEARILSSPLADYQGYETLACLKLGYNQLNDAGIEALVPSLQSHPSLATLDLGFNNIGDIGASSLGSCLESNTSLTTLYLSGNCIGPEGIKALSLGLQTNQSLTTLHLTGNPVGPEGAAAVAAALDAQAARAAPAPPSPSPAAAPAAATGPPPPPPRGRAGAPGPPAAAGGGGGGRGLQCLHLNAAELGARGVLVLARSLARAHALTELHLSDNAMGDAGVGALGAALAANPRVRCLELAFNGLGPAGAHALGRRAFGHPGLRALNLGNNAIGDQGAQVMASCLHSAPLTSLDLCFNSIGTMGLRSIFKALLGSKTMCSLSLSGNGLDSDGAQALAFTLQHSTILQKLYIDHTGISLQGEKLVAAGLLENKNAALRMLTGFRLGPALISISDNVPKQFEELTNEEVLRSLRGEPLVPKSPNQRSSDASHQRSSSAPLRLQRGDELGMPSTHEKSLLKHHRHNSVDTSSKKDAHHRESLLSSFLAENQAEALKKMAKAPYNASELWELHQYFYSPPAPATQMHAAEGSDMSEPDIRDPYYSLYLQNIEFHDSGEMHLPPSTFAEKNGHCQMDIITGTGERSPGNEKKSHEQEIPEAETDRPSKRLCAPFVKARIGYYPQIQERLDSMKSTHNQEGTLVVLRQLKFLEGLAIKYLLEHEQTLKSGGEDLMIGDARGSSHMLCGNSIQHQRQKPNTALSAFKDIETILLEVIT